MPNVAACCTRLRLPGGGGRSWAPGAAGQKGTLLLSAPARRAPRRVRTSRYFHPPAGSRCGPPASGVTPPSHMSWRPEIGECAQAQGAMA